MSREGHFRPRRPRLQWCVSQRGGELDDKAGEDQFDIASFFFFTKLLGIRILDSISIL